MADDIAPIDDPAETLMDLAERLRKGHDVDFMLAARNGTLVNVTVVGNGFEVLRMLDKLNRAVSKDLTGNEANLLPPAWLLRWRMWFRRAA